MKDNIDFLTKLAQQVDAITTVMSDLGKNKLPKTDGAINELKNKLDAVMQSVQSLENQVMPVSVQNNAVMQMVKSKTAEIDARISEQLNGSLAREYGSKLDGMLSDKMNGALEELQAKIDEAKDSLSKDVKNTTGTMSKDINFLKSKKTDYNGDEIAKAVEGKLSMTAIKDINKVIQSLSDQVSERVANSVSQPLTVDIYNGTSLVKSGVTRINAIGATFSNGVVTIPAGGGSGVATVTAGTNVTITGTASNPIINATAAAFTGVQQQFDNQTGTTVTLAATPNFVFGVYKNGIKQRVGGAKDYTIATNVITFTTALLNDDIEVVYN